MQNLMKVVLAIAIATVLFAVYVRLNPRSDVPSGSAKGPQGGERQPDAPADAPKNANEGDVEPKKGEPLTPVNPVAAAPKIPALPVAASPGGEYVGSQACSKCHAAIAASYQSTHPMASSIVTTADAADSEDLSKANFSADGIHSYLATRDDGQLVHHERLEDADGPLYDDAHPVSYVLGAPGGSQAFLIQHDEHLYQSPMFWNQKDSLWTLPPGYPLKGHARFSGKADDCLQCHAGRMNQLKRGEFRYSSKAPFAEAAIGCERCHGPGGRHVEFHRDKHGDDNNVALSDAKDDTIVNPAHLSLALQADVCNQCHLQGAAEVMRFGREADDFRPGQPLADIRTSFVQKLEWDTEWNRVDHVQQLAGSKCFQGSEGRLQCTTCHDPHSKPAADARLEHFNRRCQQCHDGGQGADASDGKFVKRGGCKLPEEKRAEAPASGSCIACHMPPSPGVGMLHAANTNHRIVRVAKKGGAIGKIRPAVDLDNVAPFQPTTAGDNGTQLSERELNRARGIARMREAQKSQNADEAVKAIKEISPAPEDFEATLAALAKDYEALEALGLAYAFTDQPEAAVRCFRESARHRPSHAAAHRWLALLNTRAERFREAQRHIEAYLRVNPRSASMHASRADVLANQGGRKVNQGIVAAERAVYFDPSQPAMRKWLAEAYRVLGKVKPALRHEDMLKRMGEAVKE